MLNVTTKGSISVYESLSSQIATTDYNLSTIIVGTLITSSGIIGFIQLLLFKQIYTSRFSDIALMVGGLFLMTIAQLIIFPYDGIEASLPRFIIAIFMMYGFGYPIGHTAIIGGFSKLQKLGKQGSLMGWFATGGSVARIILPSISGVMDSAIDHSPFYLVMILLSVSSIGIILLRTNLQLLIEGAVQVITEKSKLLDRLQIIFYLSVGLLAIVSIFFSIGRSKPITFSSILDNGQEIEFE